MENLRLAHKNAQRGKRYYKEVAEINKDPEKWLRLLQEMLLSDSYKTSEYEIFIKDDSGKRRVIYKLPYFPDRIAHWAIIQVVEPIFLNKLIVNTHSAIPKRGVHSALKQLDKYMRNSEASQYCLKMDVQKFYPSINHEKLKSVYSNMFKDDKLLSLIYEIIESVGPDEGVPIGNYLSQYSGNLYLSKFDRWMKEERQLTQYIRYMDDIVILGESKERLHKVRIDSSSYLNLELDLSLKSNWQVFPSRVRGVDFVGYRHFGSYILLRKTIAQDLISSMRGINKKIAEGRSINYSDYCSISSYKGWLKWCNGHNLYTTWIKPLEPYCEEYYYKAIKGGILT